MRMTAIPGLACLLLLAAWVAGAQAPETDDAAEGAKAAEEAPGPAAEPAAAPKPAAASARGPARAQASGESDAAAGREPEESFSPTERVSADASIRFPVDI
jgi:hypothetical protein